MAVIVLLFLDTIMVLPGIPGELILVVATHQFASSRPELIFLVIVATIGTTAGNLVLYFVARAGGRQLFDKHPKLFMMSPEKRAKFERLFQKPLGQSLVFFLRLVPLVRILVSLPAGLAKMPLLRFTILSAAGNFLFNLGVMGLTYESRQPNSVVARYAQLVRAEYAEPLWIFLKIHWLVTAATLIGMGLLFSIVNSIKHARNPNKPPSGSKFGTAAVLTLVGIGLFLIIGVYKDPALVFELILATGWDIEATTTDLPFGPYLVSALIGTLFLLMGLMATAIRRRSRTMAEQIRSGQRKPAPAEPVEMYEEPAD